MKESEFQFKNPKLLMLNYSINREYNPELDHDSEPISLEFTIEINKEKSKKEAEVILTLTIGEDSDKVPYHIVAKEGSMFRWTYDDESVVDNLLNENAPALLLSYLRPIISMVASTSPFPYVDIPFMNFTEDC